MADQRVRRINQLVAHHGRYSRAEVTTYPAASPVLSLRLDGVTIAISSWSPRKVTAGDVKFAQELAKRAVAYAMEIERRFATAAA